MNKYDLKNISIKIYYESCSEFEEIRNIALSEDNWLGKNYTKENLILENHKGFGVVYQTSTGNPMVMGGVYHDDRYPSNVANMFHRGFIFPEFRMSPKNMPEGFKVGYALINELESINNFDGYIITMQNRDKKNSTAWWDKVFVKQMMKATDGAYIKGNGYIQTAPWNVQKCWQNFIYREKTSGVITKQWNPKLITHDEWLKLDPGA